MSWSVDGAAMTTDKGRVWIVRLSCCGREDGSFTASSWAEADAFREHYLNAEGHKRSAIIESLSRADRGTRTDGDNVSNADVIEGILCAAEKNCSRECRAEKPSTRPIAACWGHVAEAIAGERDGLRANLECSRDAERILGERLTETRGALIAALAWEEATRDRLGLPQVDAPLWVEWARAALRKAGVK